MNQRVEEATAVTEAAIVEVEQETVHENGIEKLRFEMKISRNQLTIDFF